MWDLNTLGKMNDEHVKKEREDKRSLAVLARQLMPPHPPALSVLIAVITESEEYGIFIDLIREYLPEKEAEILDESTPTAQMMVFAKHFEDRYFPLDYAFRNGDVEEYGQLTRNIPIIARGLSWDDYDGIAESGRPGIQLLSYLLENPSREDDMRVALGEACLEHVTPDILERVPAEGFRIKELHDLVAGTKYSALETWGKMISLDTGNLLLDTTQEDLYSGGYNLPDWDRDEVEGFMKEWKDADKLDEQVNNLVEWLEQDTPAHFKEFLEFLLERRVKLSGTNTDKGADSLSVGDSGEPGHTAG
jgi:hypothetical protein